MSRLQDGYAGKATISKLGILHNLRNMEVKKNKNMGVHSGNLESQLGTLATMGSLIKESMKIPIILSSLVNVQAYMSIIASI